MGKNPVYIYIYVYISKKRGYLWIIVFPKWVFFFGKKLLVNPRNLTSKIPKMMGLGSGGIGCHDVMA